MVFLLIRVVLILLVVTVSFALSSIDGVSQTQQVIDCLNSYQVPFEDSTSANWTSLITPYNLRLWWYPAVVTLPFTPQHVSASVTCAAAAGLKVQAKSGGHSYASYSSGGQNGSVIVNLQNLNSVTVDNSTGIATVGGGVRLGNLALGIYAQGERALPHGTCPGVGIGGHFLHGGYGHASRLWGLSLDTIVGLDVVLANGTYIHASPTQWQSIFYAMRGAGDSFGIVTFFYLQTNPAPTSVINFSASIPAVLDSVTTVTNAFLSLQSIVADPTYINGSISFGFYSDNSGAFSLVGWCIECNLDSFNVITFPELLAVFPTPSSQSAVSMGWIDSLRNLAFPTGEPLNEPLYGYDLHDTFYAKSIVTRNAEPPTASEWANFWSFAINEGRNTLTPWFVDINLYGGAGSQINAPASNESAYGDRDELWVFQVYGYHVEPFPEDAIPFLNSLRGSLADGQSNDFGVYLNYPDPYLTAVQVAELAYGAETYDTLFELKEEYDPGFVFWNPQAIGNAPLFSSNGTQPSPNNTLPSSVDGTCGSSTGTTCSGSTFGTCCSQYDYCGDTAAYCGSGCQPEFGTCSATSGSKTSTQPTPSTDGSCGGTLSCSGGQWEGDCCSSSGACINPFDDTNHSCYVSNGCQVGLGTCLEATPDGTCGGTTNYVCTGSSFGICCSDAGWCGNTSEYCNLRCQGSAGLCLAPSQDGTCGWSTGFTCLNSIFGECCSGAGWCGNSTEYCSVADGCFTSGIDNPYLGVCTEP